MSMARFVSKFFWLGVMPAAYALPINNPLDIDLLEQPFVILPNRTTNAVEVTNWAKVRLGFVGDYVFNRHLESASLNITKQVEIARIMTNGGFIAFDLFDHLTLYGRFGATNIFFDSNASSFNQQFDARDGKRVDYFFGTTSSWNLGGQMLIFRWGNFFCNLEGQFFYTKPEVSYITFERETSAWLPQYPVKMLYTESQASFGCAYMINSMVVPFAALEWSSVHTSAGNEVFRFQGRNIAETSTLINLQNTKPIAYAIGSSVVFTEALNLTVEGRFAGEKAFSATAQLLF